MDNQVAEWYERYISESRDRSSKFAQAYGMFLGILELIEQGKMSKEEIHERIKVMRNDIWNQIQDNSVTEIKAPYHNETR